MLQMKINMQPVRMRPLLLKAGLVLMCCPLFTTITKAQSDTDSIVTSLDLKPLEVQALKIPKSWLNSSTSSYTIQPESKDQQAQNSLQEYLVETPSVFSLNVNNKAQDLRIAIRGFGSRAQFGVRGVKIIVDGIPETTTDGQGQLDNINLGIIEKIEVLNNGSAALYGNASGGVINIQTTDESIFNTKKQFANFGVELQSFNGQQYQFTVGKKINKTAIILHGNHYQGEGYRQHSGYQSTNFNLRVIQEISKRSKLEAIVNYMDSPQADDPGGVNYAQYSTDPTSARDANLQYDAGEAISKLKSSLRFTTALNDHLKLNTYVFYANREFYSYQPYESGGIIDLSRNFYGHGTSLSGNKSIKKAVWNWQVGYELSAQNDERERFNNLDGVKGATTLYQGEIFTNVGLYWANDISFNHWVVNAAIRYDINHIEAKDKMLEDGNGSGSIDLNNLNYSVGVGYELTATKMIFANYSTSFETPTLNELSNNPDGSGFNEDLKAQTATHYEVGVKGYLFNKSRFQVSVFYIESKNELISYQIEEFAGKDFYKNVGETQRQGVEFYVDYPFTKNIKASANWAFYDFTFTDFVEEGESYNGNFLPGLPNYQGNIHLMVNVLKHFKVDLQNQFIGQIYVDNANSSSQVPKAITNVSVKYTFEKEKFKLTPYFGVNNIFQTEYADNIRINAYGGRYYEAAPNMVLFGGLRVYL
tara:strand:+ start:1015 stop:3123 length:2109 start_codon:yes stop_codon:yes gene_type:complete